MSVNCFMLCFDLSVRLRKRVGCAAAEKSGGCFLRYGVSGFSLTSKWCPLGIACSNYPEFGIIRGIPRPPLSRNKRPHAEKCRHQAHFSVGVSVNYRNKNPSSILKSESQKNRNSGKHGITITAISVHKVSSVYPHRSQYRP